MSSTKAKGAKAKTTGKALTKTLEAFATPRDEAALEAQLWPALLPTVTAAVSFWNHFLGLRTGTDPLDAAALQRWIDLARAVCWVESKHGTVDGTGNQHGKVDPMQCADIRNPWWPELTKPAPSPDRFVRGPGLSNLNADELPSNAAADATFPVGAALAGLTKPADGSRDPKFTQTHSIYWGIPLLIFKTNHTYGGDACYQCDDLNFTRLTEGAGKYNGSPQSVQYVVNIKSALALFNGLSTLKLENISASFGYSALANFQSSPAGHASKPTVLTTYTSPNFSARQGKAIQYLILHNTDGPLKGSLNTLITPGGTNPRSAHYVLDRGKDIYQLVRDADMAWHAGNKPINQESIGIEVVAWKDARGMTADQETSLIALARYIVDAYDIPLKNVLPHRAVRIGGTDCPGLIWPTDTEFKTWVQTHLSDIR